MNREDRGGVAGDRLGELVGLPRGWDGVAVDIMMGRCKLSRQTARRMQEAEDRAWRELGYKKRGNPAPHRRRLKKESYLRHRDAQIERVKKNWYTLSGSYIRRKSILKQRGTPFEMTPREWTAMWLAVRKATGRERPWEYSDYRFERRDTAEAFRPGNLSIRYGGADAARCRV